MFSALIIGAVITIENRPNIINKNINQIKLMRLGGQEQYLFMVNFQIKLVRVMSDDYQI